MKDNIKIVPGQRWASTPEPELGIGVVITANPGRAEILFPATEERRTYALESAPIKRVQFTESETIKTNDGDSLVVDEVEEREGLLFYKTQKGEIPEAALSDFMSFSKPEERLLAGIIDSLEDFNLRTEALHRRSQIRQSPIRGFAGARVDLIPHQFYIADEVSSRLKPRVLLADEVGLGKTIEACMILHRLHLTYRAERILILVPEPLVHQWFVELLRRFNLLFSIYNEERCQSIEEHNSDINPFLDSQLVLCSTDFLTSNDKRATQCIDASWSLLIVDEAHHLSWLPEESSKSYQLVETLTAQTDALLLLTATPQQLGPEGHFARLRLLDPDRYTDLDEFLEEGDHYEEVASAVDRILEDKVSRETDSEFYSNKPERIREHYESLIAGDTKKKNRLMTELLDSFGTGRVIFRNTREVLKGFPERNANFYPIENLSREKPTIQKVKWLSEFLKENDDIKVLLICKTQELVEIVTVNLLTRIKVKVAQFHEGLSLIQRDRNAAYFSEMDGARILICSEIGSEGRNFQFAHHLILFDLPDTPELLEQRIGRLDRIGQTSTINIHIPYIKESDSEVMVRWYHEALNAFEKNSHGGSEVFSMFKDRIAELQNSHTPESLDILIKNSCNYHKEMAKKLERGYDRLLTLNSSKPEQAWERIEEIKALDTDIKFEEFIVRLLDYFNLHIEEFEDRRYFFDQGNIVSESFPSLPNGGMSVTFDRKTALHREDLVFMTQDHPMVRSSLDLLIGSESGNSTFGIWMDSGQESIYLEVYFVAECVAPPALHVDRFFPPTAIRIAVDHSNEDFSNNVALQNAPLKDGDIRPLLSKGAIRKKLIPEMLKKANQLANTKMQILIDNTSKVMDSQLEDEIERLENLSEINDHVTPDEIDALKNQKAELKDTIASAQLRSDAVRLIWCTK